MANTAARSVSLQEYLEEQWNLTEVDEETRRLGLAIIDAVDESGRLSVSLDDLLTEIQPPTSVAQLKDALARVQQLDPPGVAARTLQECLLLQLESLPADVQLARRMIEDHFDDLQRNRLPQIARALHVDIEDVKRAIDVIRRLSLHPGLDVVDRATPGVVPDVIVEYNEVEDRYDVRLTRTNQRELRISDEFREELEKTRGDKQARDFIRSKIDAAAAIIDAFRFRRERLLEVAKAVFEAQREFLEHGEQHIKVLRMSDMAAQFGCDPSTISRTVDEKWVQTPRGIYPLRRFFTGGLEGDNGEGSLGWDSIKAKVQEIIANEDKSNPLADDEIVDKLEAEGINIKRRTVAKYRAQLNIPAARQRRQY
jgi:RNA polymerase sigma-54 factor